MSAPAVSFGRACLHVPSVGPTGTGVIELARLAGRTAVVRRFAASPLKLLTPRAAGGCAHVVTSTYGGGLLAGDEISLRVQAGEGTRCVIGTQASTKIYRSDDRCRAVQTIDAEIGEEAVLAVAPDPVTCFAGARYAQRQTFRLRQGASLLLIDWLTSGRAARGERWEFDQYRSETRIDVEGRPVVRDALRLDSSDGPIDAPHRMGRFDCLATVLLLGPAFAAAATEMLGRVARLAVERRGALLASASPLQDGAVLRVLGPAAETVGRFIGQQLGPSWLSLGEDPWFRKW